MRGGRGVNPAFARANAAGTGGLQENSAGLAQRLARGKENGTVNLVGLELRVVPPEVFAIIDVPDCGPATAATYSGSFDDARAGESKWWENEAMHVDGGVARLMLSRNCISEIPDQLGLLVGLRTLDCSHNQIAAIPSGALAQLVSLQLLDASHNRLTQFGVSGLRELHDLKVLNLAHNDLVRLGPEIGCLSTLDECDASHNALRELPRELCECGALRALRVSSNRLEALPSDLGRLAHLEELECGQNQLRSLPDSIGSCAALARADFRQNRLGAVTRSLAACAALKELYLGINSLVTSSMPHLGQGLPGDRHIPAH